MYNEISNYLISKGFQQKENMFCFAKRHLVGYQTFNGGPKQPMYKTAKFGVVFVGDGVDYGSGLDNRPVTHWLISDGMPNKSILYTREDGVVAEKDDFSEEGLVQGIIVHSLKEFIEFINIYKRERKTQGMGMSIF